MANAILDALSGLGSGALSALSAPGDYTRGALRGRFGDRMTSRQFMNDLGFDPGDGLGGFAADMGVGIATDPLTALLPAGAALAAKYLPKAAKAVAGVASEYGPAALAADATGAGTAAGAIRGGAVAKSLGTILPGKGLSPDKALPMRRGVTFIKNADNADDVRVVGGYKDAAGKVDMDRLSEAAKVINETQSAMPAGTAGWYSPSSKIAAVYNHPATTTRATGRHELAHALIDQAAAGGSSSGLPLAWRAVAAAKRNAANPFAKRMTEIADEMVAHGADGSGAWKFLLQASPTYAEHFAKSGSPLAAAIFEGRYIPRAAAGAAGLAGAGAAGAAANYFGLGQ